MRQVGLYGPDADEQRFGDLLVGAALADQLDHVEFSPGEAVRSGATGWNGHPDPEPALLACRGREQRARAALAERPRGAGEFSPGPAPLPPRAPPHAPPHPPPSPPPPP